MQKINEWLFKIKDDEPLDISYEAAELDFDTVEINNFLLIYFKDYDIENPATARKAT